jgi:L-lactate dehydrogenase complex protein LldG
MPNNSREQILSGVRANIPRDRVEHPRIPVFGKAELDLKSTFEKRLQAAGSAVPEIPGTRRVETIRDPHELADVDVGVVRAQFGVAESGAVWLTQEDLIVNSLGFLSQHLVVLLDPEQIVADMHEAYARVRLDQTAYGCFMMGPSATGDIEATLVHGAQGARSLNLFFLAK